MVPIDEGADVEDELSDFSLSLSEVRFREQLHSPHRGRGRTQVKLAGLPAILGPEMKRVRSRALRSAIARMGSCYFPATALGIV